MSAKGESSGECLRGMEYQLLNALSVRNVEKCMDIVLRLYSCLLYTSYQTQERYSVLKLGDISPLRDENTHVIMRTYEEKEPDKKKKPQKSVRKRSTDAVSYTHLISSVAGTDKRGSGHEQAGVR